MYTKEELQAWAGKPELTIYYSETESQREYTQRDVYYILTSSPYYKEETIRNMVKAMFPEYISYEEYKKLPNDFAHYLTYHYKLEQNAEDKHIWRVTLIRPYDD